MEIITCLIEPSIQQLEHDLNSLAMEVGQHRHASPEISGLFQQIQDKKIEADRLLSELRTLTPSQLHENFRKLKLDSRFLRRSWLRILSNEERLKKMMARRSHVPLFAA